MMNNNRVALVKFNGRTKRCQKDETGNISWNEIEKVFGVEIESARENKNNVVEILVNCLWYPIEIYLPVTSESDI